MNAVSKISICFLTIAAVSSAVSAQKMPAVSSSEIRIRHIARDIAAGDMADPAWAKADAVVIKTYWSGKDAPVDGSYRPACCGRTRRCTFVLRQTGANLWSWRTSRTWRKRRLGYGTAMCARFLSHPMPREPRKYYEFEVAPTGEWIDVALDITSGTRRSDWEYRSGMDSAAKIGDARSRWPLKFRSRR